MRINEFQVLMYATQEVRSTPSMQDILNASAYRGDTLSYGGGATRGIGVGFGNAEAVTAKTTGIRITGLEGAFDVVVVPASV